MWRQLQGKKADCTADQRITATFHQKYASQRTPCTYHAPGTGRRSHSSLHSSRQGGGLTYPCRNHSSQGLCHFPGSPKWQAAKLHSNPRLPSSKARLLISKHLCLLETHSWGEGEKGRKENGNVKQATPSAPAEDSEQWPKPYNP